MAESERDQRTEEATPRRRQEARERGQVALSSEFVAVAGLLAGAGALAFGGPALCRRLAEELVASTERLGDLGAKPLDVPAWAGLVSSSAEGLLGALALVVVPTVAVAALAGYLQVGLHVAPKALEADPAKLDPVRGLGRLFSLRGATRTGFALAKVFLITGVAGAVTWMHASEILEVGHNQLGPLLLASGTVLARVAMAVLTVLLALGGLDVLVQRLQQDRDLRMTRAEVKEEHRLLEGDPHVRARLRAARRELVMQRMMSDLPKATVVVTNPTHYAVALRYERGAAEARAPVVVAKGLDHLAERIKVLAAVHGVPQHEDVALARALYRRVKVGQEIPEELFGAVAAVLAHVYRLQGAEAG
jgi:flagellar biosynthetic protein FlhB